jgi:hypothetical protein
MPEIKRVELERDTDQGVHEVKEGERLDPVDPVPPQSTKDSAKGHPGKDKRRKDDEEFERATTPFPGG